MSNGCERYPDAEHSDTVDINTKGSWQSCSCGRWRKTATQSPAHPVPVLACAILDALGAPGLRAKKVILELKEDWDAIVYCTVDTRQGRDLKGIAANLKIVKDAVVIGCKVETTPLEADDCEVVRQEDETILCICGHSGKDHQLVQSDRVACVCCGCRNFQRK